MECLKQFNLDYNQKQNSTLSMNYFSIKEADVLETHKKRNRRNRQVLSPSLHQNSKNQRQGHFKQSVLPQKHSNLQNNPQKLPTIYRKHEYDGKQFTQIYNMKTATSQIRTKSIIKYTIADFNEIAAYDSILVNISEVSSENTYKKSEWKQFLNSNHNCNCSNNQCKQNYCVCFKQGRSCDLSCLCQGCQNYQSKSLISDIIGVNSKQKQTNNSEIKQYLFQKAGRNRAITESAAMKSENFNKCHCRKSGGCLLRYCGCRRLGINCSNLCQCSECKN